jgi:23S rRNA A2030 N6-methylase RlmJ
MYDHNIKAGNQGDIMKHVALIAAVQVLMETCGKTFHYADTYAGYAYNPLKSNGEWRNGIGVLHDSGFVSRNPAVKFWQDLWECKSGLRGSVYPGSSLFMLKLSMEKGLAFQARLWDISPAVIYQLVTFYDQNEVDILPRPAKIIDFVGYKPDLLLIDPPDLNYVDKALELFDLVENVILWLPVITKGGEETEASCHAYQKCKDTGLSIISVSWDSNQNTRGCRLVYRLPSNADIALKSTMVYVVKLIGENLKAVLTTR